MLMRWLSGLKHIMSDLAEDKSSDTLRLESYNYCNSRSRVYYALFSPLSVSALTYT